MGNASRLPHDLLMRIYRFVQARRRIIVGANRTIFWRPLNSFSTSILMSRDPLLTRRTFLAGVGATLAAAALPVFSTAAFAANEHAKELRIGYQKAASTLVLLKAHGTLEKRLAPLGITVEWTEFPAGPQLLEGLNVGAIDFGYVGEAPPVFAQAAGANFVYTAYEIPTPHAEGILVHPDAPIKTLADLKERGLR
ncbi:ABC-type nitrate/sulfonate/bicarbonate transport system substrate-binding protein [Paraburkholderia sp. WSM4179]|nr:ABC-type nitrate/sulfonate/bicarbonate transport system substrate-binding protein [Paraburkholderia sp. WSM4179]